MTRQFATGLSRRHLPHIRFLIALASAVAVASSVGATLSGASAQSPTPAPTATGPHAPAGTNRTLTWGMAVNPRSLFAGYCFSVPCSVIFSLVHQHILEPGNFGQPTTGQGAVVASTRALNRTTYVYTIKRGLRFSNGARVTAADVAFSINLHRNRQVASQMASFFEDVRSVSARGNRVTIRLKKPNSNWPFTTTASAGLVYSRADYQRKRANFGTAGAMPIGSGPYRFAEFQPNSRVVLARNRFWRGRTFPWSRIVIAIIPDPQARLLALQSGRIDGTFDVPGGGLSTWFTAPNVRAGTYISGGWRGFSIDVQDGPFRDIRVRRAIAHSIDKVGLNRALNGGRGSPIAGLPPLVFLRGLLPKAELTRELKKVRRYPFSLSRARSELRRSRFPRGFNTTINVPADSPAAIAITQNVAQNLRRIGINMNLNLMPGGPRFQVILDHKGPLGMQILGQGPSTPHPMHFLDLLYKSEHAAPGFENSANYRNRRVDRLIEQGLRTTNLRLAARNALKVMQIAAQDLPYIPIFTFPGTWAVREQLRISRNLRSFYYNQIWLKHLSGR